MSASTVSVSANPTRRRQSSTMIGDMKQSIEIVNDTTVSPNLGNNGGGDDKIGTNTNNKDLSHSIRGEAILERSSRETVPNKKSTQLGTNSNAVPRSRNRKVGAMAAPKNVKPRWQTVLRVLGKNLMLVLVLVGLVQMVRKLVGEGGNGGEGSGLMGFSDMEGRIAQVESSLKTTSKMLQVQVEVVDKKVESLVGDMRRDVNKRLEDKSLEIDTRFRGLDERSVALETALSELKSKDLLTKEDLGRLYDELKKGKRSGGVDEAELSLDEIRALAREIVEKELEKHAADGLGRVDYALGSAGAVVVKHSDPLVVGKIGNWFAVGNRQGGVHSDADKMLKPSFGEPGQCFALKGSSGFVQIRLRTAIVPEAITLEHVAKSVAYDRSSAPKHCRVSGWLQGSQGQQGLDSELTVDSEKMSLLTEFTYDLEKSNAQTFSVFDSASSAVINTVRFDFTSNHGSPSHTCIYRLRVHGHETNSIQMIAADS